MRVNLPFQNLDFRILLQRADHFILLYQRINRTGHFIKAIYQLPDFIKICILNLYAYVIITYFQHRIRTVQNRIGQIPGNSSRHHYKQAPHQNQNPYKYKHHHWVVHRLILFIHHGNQIPPEKFRIDFFFRSEITVLRPRHTKGQFFQPAFQIRIIRYIGTDTPAVPFLQGKPGSFIAGIKQLIDIFQGYGNDHKTGSFQRIIIMHDIIDRHVPFRMVSVNPLVTAFSRFHIFPVPDKLLIPVLLFYVNIVIQTVAVGSGYSCAV